MLWWDFILVFEENLSEILLFSYFEDNVRIMVGLVFDYKRLLVLIVVVYFISCLIRGCWLIMEIKWDIMKVYYWFFVYNVVC